MTIKTERWWYVVRVAAFGLFMLAISSAAHAATPPASDSVVVSATNGGSVSFTIILAAYSFGTVDANGTANVGGTQALTGTVSATGATYTALTATTWRATSAPPATMYIYNTASTSTINWGNAGRLSMRLPATNLAAGTVSCGLKSFTTTGDGGAAGCASGNLVRNVLVKNGANAAVGDVDFELFVANTDATGTNTWVVVLTEVGL